MRTLLPRLLLAGLVASGCRLNGLIKETRTGVQEARELLSQAKEELTAMSQTRGKLDTLIGQLDQATKGLPAKEDLQEIKQFIPELKTALGLLRDKKSGKKGS